MAGSVTSPTKRKKHDRLQGVVFILLGVVAIVFPLLFTVSFALMVSLLLVIGGVTQFMQAYQGRKTGVNAALSISVAVLLSAAGVVLFAAFITGLALFSFVLALAFVAVGLVMIVFSTLTRPPHWEWLAISGIVSLTVGFLIWVRWPFSSVWFLGMIIGINLIFFGIAQIKSSSNAQHQS